MNVRKSENVPILARADFFTSPPQTYALPVYAEALAQQYVAVDPRRGHRGRLLDPRVLQFVDDCAVESDSELSNSEDNTI